MHPEIEKFWKDLGYYIIIDVLQSDLWRFYWVLMKNERQIKFAGVSDDVPQGTKKAPCTRHFIDDKEYSEEEMLKIIGLKAFL